MRSIRSQAHARSLPFYVGETLHLLPIPCAAELDTAQEPTEPPAEPLSTRAEPPTPEQDDSQRNRESVFGRSQHAPGPRIAPTRSISRLRTPAPQRNAPSPEAAEAREFESIIRLSQTLEGQSQSSPEERKPITQETPLSSTSPVEKPAPKKRKRISTTEEPVARRPRLSRSFRFVLINAVRLRGEDRPMDTQLALSLSTKTKGTSKAFLCFERDRACLWPASGGDSVTAMRAGDPLLSFTPDDIVIVFVRSDSSSSPDARSSASRTKSTSSRSSAAPRRLSGEHDKAEVMHHSLKYEMPPIGTSYDRDYE